MIYTSQANAFRDDNADSLGSCYVSDVRTGEAVSVLERLVGFESLSARPNLDIVGYVRDYLAALGVAAHLSFDDSGHRANLHATIGPLVDGGVVLNGHTDVVPVDGQAWTSDPFRLIERDGRLYGRGAVDMKGFLACMLASVPVWQAKVLSRPIQISMCYDEEIGGLGAPILVDDMGRTAPRPRIAIIGEPTGMRIISGHKGGLEMRTVITGFEAHASDPRKGVNAIICAARFIAMLDDLRRDLASRPRAGSPFDPAWTTISVGTIHGGAARNIIAGTCAFDWEIRPVPGDDGDALIARVADYARTVLLPEMRAASPAAAIETEIEARVPALNDEDAREAVALLSELTGQNSAEVVAFGTDAGHFCNAGISTVVFGPGSIEQAHKPDEFIERSQIAACMSFLDRLGDRLTH